MEFLHTWKQKGTPELHATELPPIFIDPTWAFAEILGDLLDRHNTMIVLAVNGTFKHGCPCTNIKWLRALADFGWGTPMGKSKMARNGRCDS